MNLLKKISKIVRKRGLFVLAKEICNYIFSAKKIDLWKIKLEKIPEINADLKAKFRAYRKFNQELDSVLKEFDEFVREDFERGFKKGAEAFVFLINGEIAHYSWTLYPDYYPNPVKLNAKESYIGNCFTNEKFRGHRLYPKMLSKICGILKKKGFSRVFMIVDEKNIASQRGVENAGFAKTKKFLEIKIFGASRFIRLK